MRRTHLATLAASAVLFASAGCRHGDRRGAEVDPSTIGRDRASYPRGSTIPPSGFGVDLARRKGATLDPSAAPASGAFGER